jgi:hypothetical protein
MEWTEHVDWTGAMINAYNILVRKYKVKRTWNTHDSEETRRVRVGWIYMAQDWDLVNLETNLEVPQKVKISFI